MSSRNLTPFGRKKIKHENSYTKVSKFIDWIDLQIKLLMVVNTLVDPFEVEYVSCQTLKLAQIKINLKQKLKVETDFFINLKIQKPNDIRKNDNY